MYLKKLELAGFKSFAGRTSISLEPGVVGIVGPNGSGKSNLADAVRWVLGEQSAKMLRLSKSEEIVFAGTRKKAKASMAEVTLLLDNSDGKMPLDWSEVEITRRLYRSGDSSYLLNGRKVRLLDLQEMLAKSGFGQNSYSVIGQGMIDKLLIASPAERKALFDEASGIKQYELRRLASLRKLDQTKANIAELDGVLLSLRPEHEALVREVSALERRGVLESELETARKNFLAFELVRADQLITSHKLAVDKAESRLAEISTGLSALQRERNEEAASEVAENKRRQQAIVMIGRITSRRSKKVDELSKLEAEEKYNQSQNARDIDSAGRSKALAKELEMSQKKLAKVAERIQVISKSIDSYDSSIDKVGVVLHSLNKEFADHRRELQRGQRREYLNHAMGLINLLAKDDNVVTMSKKDRGLALHKLRRMIKLAIEDRSDSLAQEISSLQAKITRQMARREDLVEQRNKEIIHLRSLELDSSSILEHTESIKAELAEAEKRSRLVGVESAGHNHREAIARLKSEITDLDKQLASAQAEATATISNGSAQKSARAKQIESLVEQRVKLDLELSRLRAEIDAATAQKATFGKLHQDWFGSKLPERMVSKGRSSQADIARLEAELNLVGQLDPSLTKEAEAVGKQLEDLTTQRDDLAAAQQDLLGVVGDLEVQIRDKFKSGFESINTQFGYYFAKLFSGGKAELAFEVDQAGNYGIEIIATPPGKHTQQLAMLSGGERSLGGIALLAAIMAVNPSPFVILDEVDAALDDSNSSKFSNVLSDLAKHTQLIVITHNHETMLSASQLVGITSDAEGGTMAVVAHLDHVVTQ